MRFLLISVVLYLVLWGNLHFLIGAVIAAFILSAPRRA